MANPIASATTLLKTMKSNVVNPNDPRILKTKKLLKEAFEQLVLVYDDYMSITVKELCDKAGVNRKTFYLHYRQVDDLFAELQNEAVIEFYTKISGIDIYSDVESVIRVYFEMNESNPVYQKLCLSPHYVYIKEIGRKKGATLYEEKEGSEKLIHDNAVIRDYIASFYYYSGYVLYSKWVKSNRLIPMDDAIKLASNLIKNGVSSMKKPE